MNVDAYKGEIHDGMAASMIDTKKSSWIWFCILENSICERGAQLSVRQNLPSQTSLISIAR